MLEQDKVIKLELCTLKGSLLMTVTNNYSFPKRISGDKISQDVMMIKNKNLPVFAKGAFINVIAYMKSGDRINYPAVIEMSIDSQLNLLLHFDKAQMLKERRRYYKIDSDESCRITGVSRGDKQEEFEPAIPAKIKNINLGGIFLQILQKMELISDDILTIEVPNMAGNFIALSVKILRVQKDQEGLVLGYGCCFLFLASKEEQILAKYINRLQIEKRALERENERKL